MRNLCLIDRSDCEVIRLSYRRVLSIHGRIFKYTEKDLTYTFAKWSASIHFKLLYDNIFYLQSKNKHAVMAKTFQLL